MAKYMEIFHSASTRQTSTKSLGAVVWGSGWREKKEKTNLQTNPVSINNTKWQLLARALKKGRQQTWTLSVIAKGAARPALKCVSPSSMGFETSELDKHYMLKLGHKEKL